VFLEDRQLGTWACVDSFMLPGGGFGFGQGTDCGSGWVQVDTPGGVVWSDPCAPGLICVNEPELASGWSCQPYCDASLECSSTNGRCLNYDDPQGFMLRLPACHPTDNCSVVTVGEFAGGSFGPYPCPTGEVCFLSYDWYSYDAHAECFAGSGGTTAVGDECATLDDCVPGAVCIGPLGVDPDLWGDGDATHAFRCHQVCPDPLRTSCANCTPLSSWGLDTVYLNAPPSLCPLPAPGGGTGGTSGASGSGAGGAGGF
jgi:hypothetical protein